MSKTIALSLLQQGNTGNEILQILDTIVGDTDGDAISMSVTPTLQEIQF